MASYNPTTMAEMTSTHLIFNGKGVKFTVDPDSTVNNDFQMPNDCVFSGGGFGVQNAQFGDYITLKVIDIDGVLVPAGTTLSTILDTWYIASNTELQLQPAIPYPSKTYTGLYLRLTYVAVAGGSTRNVFANYVKHKIV